MKGLQVGVGDPGTYLSVGSVEGQSCAVFVEGCGTCGDDRGTEEVDAVLFSDTKVEAVEGSTGVCEVADTDEPLTAELQFLAPGKDMQLLMLEQEVSFVQVEGVMHVRVHQELRKSGGMRVLELEAHGEKRYWLHSYPCADTGQPVHLVAAGQAVVGRLSLEPPP